ncbi:MAG: type II toxin-antitoxin system HipA family toxin [Gammaproteobacteria bacterium]|nr:type II toxin-antitoxin system HipA family toxin [Gammaproteobacteria bacterium]
MVQNVSSDPAVDAEYLLRWQIFNVLAGNSDGHAKNLSFIYYPRGEVRLAPFYDLVCTRAIKYIDSNLAFSVGGERNPGRVMQTQWNTLANDCDVGQKYLNGLVKETGGNLLENMKSAREQFEQQNVALQRIRRHCYTAVLS